jgi:hypothetical protein
MTVTRHDPQTIVLAGPCPVDDAEPLLQMLLETPDAVVDWRACQSPHTAVVQVVMTAGPALIGPCGDAWTETWLASGIRQAGGISG